MVKEIDILQDWVTLNDNIMDKTEEECFKLLTRAKKEKKGVSFLLRIYGRYNVLRTLRERSELVKG